MNTVSTLTLRLWLSPEETAELESRNRAAVLADYELSERLGRELLCEMYGDEKVAA